MEGNTVIVACATLKSELELTADRCGCTAPVVWLESGLHSHPDKLNARLQDLLDQLPSSCATVLLAMGFCGNSLVGIRSGPRTLVVPTVSDCITIYLGSNEMRDRLGPDTYFFTEGYLRCETTVLTEHEYYRRRYGDQKAERLTKTIMAHYGQLAVVDTGAFAIAPVVRELEDFAEMLGVPVIVVPGDLCILENLLSGKWEFGKYLKVPPGGKITFHDSLHTGSSQVIIKS